MTMTLTTDKRPSNAYQPCKLNEKKNTAILKTNKKETFETFFLQDSDLKLCLSARLRPF